MWPFHYKKKYVNNISVLDTNHATSHHIVLYTLLIKIRINVCKEEKERSQ